MDAKPQQIIPKGAIVWFIYLETVMHIYDSDMQGNGLSISILQDDDEKGIDMYINNSTSPRIVGSGDILRPDPLYICMEGKTVVGPLKNATLLDAAVLLLACYYAFNMQYPQQKNVFFFLEAVLLDKTDDLKGRISFSMPLTTRVLHLSLFIGQTVLFLQANVWAEDKFDFIFPSFTQPFATKASVLMGKLYRQVCASLKK